MKPRSINPRALGTNSLTNAIMASSASPAPTKGMGGTILGYTDRYAVTVIGVLYTTTKKLAEVIVQEDNAIRTDKNGQSESQNYRYEANPKAPWRFFSVRKNGAWVERGQPLNGGTRLVLGERDHYIDPSF